jgi:outer membrane protein assembly factor BamB
VFAAPPGGPAIHRKNGHASPTPIVAGGRLFVHFGHLGTAALDLDGQVLWRNTSVRYSPVHGAGGSPILVGNRLIFTADGEKDPFVVALTATTGEVTWRTPRHSNFPRTFSFATPELIRLGNQSQIVAPGSGLIAAYNPEDGTEQWRVRHEGWSVIPKPVFAHGLVFVGTGYESPTTLAIRPEGRGDITDSQVRWTLRRGAPNTPSFLAVGDELYLLADNGVLSCLDARTGTVHYQERACGPSSASPVFAEGRIYLLDEEGLGVVIAAGKQFRKVAENPIRERTLASYAVTDGALFIRSAEHLFKIENSP